MSDEACLKSVVFHCQCCQHLDRVSVSEKFGTSSICDGKEMRPGAVILCGGKSSRMGQDKAALPFGPETMLQRVARLISEVVDPKNLVVVAEADQSLPVLPVGVTVAHDSRQFRGPLEGLATGLRAL